MNYLSKIIISCQKRKLCVCTPTPQKRSIFRSFLFQIAEITNNCTLKPLLYYLHFVSSSPDVQDPSPFPQLLLKKRA